MAMDSPFLTVEQAAQYLGLTKQTLDNWRSTRRGGPPFVKLSPRAVRYNRADLLRWMDQRRIDPNASASYARTRQRSRRSA